MKLLTPFVIETPEQTRARKKLFAEALLKNPGDPFKVALSVIPDTGEALRAAQEWPADFEVIAFQKELTAERGGEGAFLPTDVEAARLAFDIASGAKSASQEQINALELYGKIRGFIQKPGVSLTQNNVTVNKVMVVRDHGPPDEWEAKARRQQEVLIAEATVVEHGSGN